MTALALKTRGRNGLLRLALIAGLDRLLAPRRIGKLVILCYHGIRSKDSTPALSFSRRNPPVDVFERQLLWLKQYNYQFITLSEAVARWEQGRPLPDRAVCLTFDDGYQNVIANAYPIMQRLGACGCLYVIAGLPDSERFTWTDVVEMALWVSKGRAFALNGNHCYILNTTRDILGAVEQIEAYLRSIPDRERLSYMPRFEQVLRESIPTSDWMRELKPASWESLASLDSEIMEIGSHSWSHPNLDRVAEEDLGKEVHDSKRRIEERIGRQVLHFCYPCGAFTPTVQRYVRQAGYLTATSTLPGLNDASADRFALRRYMIYSDMTLFQGHVTGVHGFLFGRSMT